MIKMAHQKASSSVRDWLERRPMKTQNNDSNFQTKSKPVAHVHPVQSNIGKNTCSPGIKAGCQKDYGKKSYTNNDYKMPPNTTKHKNYQPKNNFNNQEKKLPTNQAHSSKNISASSSLNTNFMNINININNNRGKNCSSGVNSQSQPKKNESNTTSQNIGAKQSLHKPKPYNPVKSKANTPNHKTVIIQKNITIIKK